MHGRSGSAVDRAVDDRSSIVLATVPVISAVCRERVLQSMHGRVFDFRNVLSQVLSPMDSVAAGLIDADIAAPAMAADGAFAASIGRLIGVAAGLVILLAR
jgi:hypothetical protein